MFDHDKLNFQVEKFPLYQGSLSYGDQVPTEIGVGLRRVDDKQVLALVTDSYEPTQYLTMRRS